MHRFFLFPLCLFLLIHSSALSEQWSRFRGPNGSGSVEQGNFPIKWSEDNYLWKTRLPGKGNSSPVIWNEHVIVTSGDPEIGNRIVVCLDLSSGKKIWEKTLKAENHSYHARNSLASSTPAIDAQRVYITWATPTNYFVVALDHHDQGREIWRKNIGKHRSKHGFGSSPIVWNDQLIITNDHQEQGLIMALDCKTGNVVWKKEREKTKTAYSTPCIFSSDQGKPQLIITNYTTGMSGLNLKSGDTIWKIEETFPHRTVGSPIVANKLLVANCGTGNRGNMVTVDPYGTDDKQPKILYTKQRGAPYVPTVISYGKLLFMWSDQGIATCLDLVSGKKHWQKRVGGSFFGSPVRVKDRIYIISESGIVHVIAASKTYRHLAKNKLGEISRATPAITKNKMLFRTETNLYCLESER